MERERTLQQELSTPLDVNFDGIPQELQQYHQWVVWKYLVIGEEIKKPPFTPRTGRYASVANPRSWGSFEEARAAYLHGRYAGVGFAIKAENGIVGIDIDHCIEKDQCSPEALRIVEQVNTYTTLSPSGAGLRLFLYGSLPDVYRRSSNIEMYQDKRYLTITGQRLANTPLTLSDDQEALNAVYNHVFAHRQEQQLANTIREDHTSYYQSLTDEQVLQKAYAARNGDLFKRYYEGDHSVWEDKSHSQADFTLCLMLLYWTNGDTLQVDRLFRKSGLMRRKWDRRTGETTYGALTIDNAKRLGRRSL
jgi:putative DNA primase/helicase